PGEVSNLEPDKYATSIADAMSKMVGHVVCCTSQSVALISGTFGNAAASLTFDEYFKKRRQSRLEAQSKTIADVLTQSTKGFAFGVILGISGVFTKPVVGAYEEGVEGFFKGLGKGIFGLITKPGSAVFDVVTLTFDGIRRLMETDDNVVIRTRLPRCINPHM
ncbi:Vacuolar protein sorting-associated protein 13C-like protein, partial [Leptotrombidium deliense]